MIDKWKLALKEFLKAYEEDDDVIGAILCGSFAYETYNEYSNIKVYLLLKDSATYSEEGVLETNSYLIRYYKRNYKEIKKIIEDEYQNNELITAHMIAYGKMIYDLDGMVKKVQDLAFEYLDKDLSNITDDKLLDNNYNIWNYQNKLKKLVKDNDPTFCLIYYKLLDLIFDSYFEFLEIPKLPKSKIYKILTNEDYKRKYNIFKLPEEEFIKLYIMCLDVDKNDLMYKNIDSLIKYYYNKQGGFNIRTFNIKHEGGV